MIWKMFLPTRPTQAVITQNATDGNGTPGRLTVPGVVSLRNDAGQLQGVDRQGRVILSVPLSDVAAAIVDEVNDAS